MSRRCSRRAAPRPCIVEFGGLKVGMLICYDVEFPENVRRLAQAGAELVLVPTALPAERPCGLHRRAASIPVRAFENQVFVAYANHCGADAILPMPGCRASRRRTARTLAAADAALCLLFADIDPAAYAAARDANPYLDDLRQSASRFGQQPVTSWISALPWRWRSPWRHYTKAASPPPIADLTPVMSETISLPSVLSRSTAPTIRPRRNTTMRSTRSNTWRRLWLIRISGIAALLQAADDVFDLRRLLHAKRGRRLVHDDELRGEGRRAADRHALALAARHVADGVVRDWES